jgi:hypothetical protein
VLHFMFSILCSGSFFHLLRPGVSSGIIFLCTCNSDVECVVEDGASVRGVVFTTGVCKVAGTVKTTRKVDFEINPIDPKKIK